MKKILALVLIFFSLMACQKPKDQPEIKEAAKDSYPPSQLHIWAPQRIRTLGLEQTILKDFAETYNCNIELKLFENISALLDSLKNQDSKPDLVLGLDNASSSDPELLSTFLPINDLAKTQFSRELYLDPQKRLAPYAYANLAVIYNSRIIKEGPSSFGELQDAAYFRQIGICDPFQTGEGLGSLFWTLALFHSPGYQTLWQSIKKNIKDLYPDYESAIQALISGKINLLIGYNSTPAWLEDTNQTDKSFKFNLLKEGSWQYSEAAAIPNAAANPATASRFISFLLEPKNQNLIPYKLGLFPTNSKAQLPIRFAQIPISSFTVNKRLKEDVIQEQLPAWKEYLQSLFELKPLEQ